MNKVTFSNTPKGQLKRTQRGSFRGDLQGPVVCMGVRNVEPLSTETECPPPTKILVVPKQGPQLYTTFDVSF